MRKILVVIAEDDQKLCDKYRFALEKTTDIFPVKTTGTLIEAIESIKQYAPDIVILDLLLENGACGSTVLKAIRELKDSITQPGFMILTNNKNPNLMSYYTEIMGADTYYTKSQNFNGDDFVEKIRKTFDLICQIGVNVPGSRCESRHYRPLSNVDKIRNLESAVSARLERDGMLTGRGSGKTYLVDLIVLAVQNGGMIDFRIKDHSTIIADKHKTTGNRICRNISSAATRAHDFVTSPLYESNSSIPSPFARVDKYRTPFILISYYAEIFRHFLE